MRYSLNFVELRSKIFWTLVCTVFTGFTSTESRAFESGCNFSAFVGPGFELNENNTIVPIYGITGAYAFKNQIEVGIEVAMRGPLSTIGLDANYYFGHGIFAGIQTGLDFDKLTTYYLGPQMGIDLKIYDQFAISPELQYLYTIHDRGGIFESLINIKYFLP